MAEYRLEFKKSVFKDLKKVDKARQEYLLKKAKSLANMPFPQNVRKLGGTEQLYRIIYEVDPANKFILIHYIRHRKDAYKKF